MATFDLATLFGVRGRVALVTGGTSGIGLMIAKALVENGAKVYVAALASDPIDEKVSELNAIGKGGSAVGFAVDLTSKDEILSLAERLALLETHLDMLVSNAGVRLDPPRAYSPLRASLAELQAGMLSAPHADWDTTFRVNTTAHYFLSVALLPLLARAAHRDPGTGREGRDDGRGCVVVTSSCASLHNCSNVDLTSYAASKAATDHLVRLLAAKFARWYVRVNAINPGFVPSNMNKVGAEDNIFANLFDKVPAKRAGRSEDIAGTVLYLCSKAGAYTDGVTLCVDGGRVLLANGQE